MLSASIFYISFCSYYIVLILLLLYKINCLWSFVIRTNKLYSNWMVHMLIPVWKINWYKTKNPFPLSIQQVRHFFLFLIENLKWRTLYFIFLFFCSCLLSLIKAYSIRLSDFFLSLLFFSKRFHYLYLCFLSFSAFLFKKISLSVFVFSVLLCFPLKHFKRFSSSLIYFLLDILSFFQAFQPFDYLFSIVFILFQYFFQSYYLDVFQTSFYGWSLFLSFNFVIISFLSSLFSHSQLAFSYIFPDYFSLCYLFLNIIRIYSIHLCTCLSIIISSPSIYLLSL